MSVEQLLGFRGQIQIADIGAAFINERPVYTDLIDRGLAHLTAFDGDARQTAAIAAAYGDDVTVIPAFISDGTTRTLYLAERATGMTSLLEPSDAALKFFNGFPEFGRGIGTEDIATSRLDDVADVPLIDFLKMDVQGSELTVLEHGHDTLKDCVAIQLEVSFIALYERQPTFGQVDVWMRAQGFAPHCFEEIKCWSIAPTINGGSARIPFRQLLEADIAYVRDPLSLGLLTDEQLVKYALVSHYCYASPDLCAHVIIELERRDAVPADTRTRYYELRNASPPASR